MATITAFVRPEGKGKPRPMRVRFRLRDGVNVQVFHTSDIEVLPAHWDADRQTVKAKVIMDADERLAINSAVADRKKLLAEVYHAAAGRQGEELRAWMAAEVERRLNPTAVAAAAPDFFSLFAEFITVRPAGDARKRSLRTLLHALQRYERYKRLSGNRAFTLAVDTFTEDTLRDFKAFMETEGQLAGRYPDLYISFPKPTRDKRGINYLARVLGNLRTFFRWLEKNEVACTKPFAHYQIDGEAYGTPIYISIEERNAIYAADLSASPTLAVQRDVFVFQCLVGCRVGDLLKLTPDNVIDGVLEYIPRKTRDGRPVTIKVPLNAIATEIVHRYKDNPTGKLLPFADSKAYNVAIRKVFEAVGLTYKVTVLTAGRGEEKRRICDIASSHMARRHFVGCLYKQLKDPNLIASLSGHVEGSQAFARYRTIDTEIKAEVVKLLE